MATMASRAVSISSMRGADDALAQHAGRRLAQGAGLHVLGEGRRRGPSSSRITSTIAFEPHSLATRSPVPPQGRSQPSAVRQVGRQRQDARAVELVDHGWDIGVRGGSGNPVEGLPTYSPPTQGLRARYLSRLRRSARLRPGSWGSGKADGAVVDFFECTVCTSRVRNGFSGQSRSRSWACAIRSRRAADPAHRAHESTGSAFAG